VLTYKENHGLLVAFIDRGSGLPSPVKSAAKRKAPCGETYSATAGEVPSPALRAIARASRPEPARAMSPSRS
jgi:hypothetical protein